MEQAQWYHNPQMAPVSFHSLLIPGHCPMQPPAFTHTYSTQHPSCVQASFFLSPCLNLFPTTAFPEILPTSINSLSSLRGGRKEGKGLVRNSALGCKKADEPFGVLRS